jgi:hypothetical protein
VSLGRVPERSAPDAVGRALIRLAPPFGVMKWLSFLHSGIYVLLIVLAVSDQALGLKTIVGWCHGFGWIGMCVLTIATVRAKVIPLWLGACVAVLGGVGPFVGSIGFVVEQRRRERRGVA